MMQSMLQKQKQNKKTKLNSSPEQQNGTTEVEPCNEAIRKQRRYLIPVYDS